MAKVKSHAWNGEPAKYVHLKVDGHYTRIVTEISGVVKVYTSHPTDITAQCRNYNWLRPHYARVPFGTVILGELYVGGRTSSDVKTALVEEWKSLEFSAFAVETMPPEAPLEDVAAFCARYGIDFLPWRRIVEGDTVEALMAKLPHNGEGYVLKNGNMLDWYKLKRVKTIDLIVDGYTDGRGKYEYQIGSLVCRTIEGYYIATAGGMDDALRYEITVCPSKYLGRVAEIKYQGVGSGGRLRHPRFCRWRDDKLPEDCGIGQDPELEEYYDGDGRL